MGASSHSGRARWPSSGSGPPDRPKGPIYDAADYRRRFPDGRIGSNPALANVEDGKKLYETALEETAEAFQAFAFGPD